MKILSYDRFFQNLHVYLKTLTISLTLLLVCFIVGLYSYWFSAPTNVITFTPLNQSYTTSPNSTLLIKRTYVVNKTTQCLTKRYLKMHQPNINDQGLYYFYHDISLPQEIPSSMLPFNGSVLHAINIPNLPKGEYIYVSTLYCQVNPVSNTTIRTPDIPITIY